MLPPVEDAELRLQDRPSILSGVPLRMAGLHRPNSSGPCRKTITPWCSDISVRGFMNRMVRRIAADILPDRADMLGGQKDADQRFNS
jgi:hypothetical protein